ncbi:MAG: DUF308 domain-containing protein [Prevotella sp.]|nr:DUF308 domain-containing protein [Prevotella sp.]
MNIIRNSILRAVAALVVGALLIKYPDTTLSGLTIAIGILFLVAGIISLVAWVYQRQKTPSFSVYSADDKVIQNTQPMFPVVGLGSLLLGAILALMPETFIRLQMYFVAALLILGSLNLYMNLIAARTFGHVSAGFWLMPTVILLAGIVVMVKPMESAALPLIILGWGMLLFGVVEMICSLKYFQLKRKAEKAPEEAEAIPYDEPRDATAGEGANAEEDTQTSLTEY